MEKHFLQDLVEGEPEFHPEPWYNPFGDCIVYKMADEAVVADRIDGLLTIYRSAQDDRPIGFQIKGVAAIIRKFGVDGLLVSSEADGQAVKRVSIAALLLAAYEEGPQTVGRRLGYAAAMECPVDRSIAALLLAAYEEGPQTVGRRKAYVEAMCPGEKTIPADELQPA